MHNPSMSELRELSNINYLKTIMCTSQLNKKEFGLIASMKNVVNLDMNFNDSLMDLLIQMEDLKYLTMRGTIPNISGKLGRMKNLTYLEFRDGDYIKQPVLEEIATMINLEHLKIMHIVSETQQSFNKLSSLSNLKTFRFSSMYECNGKIKDLGLSNLTDLEISYDTTDEEMEHIGSLRNLTRLSMIRSPISLYGAQGLVQLSNLTYLNVSNSIGNIEPISQMTSLRTLIMSRAMVGINIDQQPDDVMTAKLLSNLTNLTALNLTFHRIGDEGLEYLLRNLKSLSKLNISGSSITIKGVELLVDTNLKHLTIFRNEIGDEGAILLSKMDGSLEELRVGDGIGYTGLMALGQSKILNIYVKGSCESNAERIRLLKYRNLKFSMMPPVDPDFPR